MPWEIARSSLVRAVAFAAGAGFAFALGLLGSLFPQAWLRPYAVWGVPTLIFVAAICLGTRSRWAQFTLGRLDTKTTAVFLAYTGALAVVLRGAFVLASLRAYPLDMSRFRFHILSLQIPSDLLARGCLLSPISEEFFFRGWAPEWLEGRLKSGTQPSPIGLSGGEILATLAFAGFHIANPMPFTVGTYLLNLLNTAGSLSIGILLCRAKKRSGGLLLPILCHSAVNMLGASLFTFIPR